MKSSVIHTRHTQMILIAIVQIRIFELCLTYVE